MLARRLHLLLAEDGIPVTAVSPGWVRTDMGGANAHLSIEESAQAVSTVIAGHGPDDAPFLDHEGTPIPW